MKIKVFDLYFWLMGLVALIIIALMGTKIPGDFIGYKLNYSNASFAEPLFRITNLVMSRVVPFEIFFILVGIFQLVVITKIRKETSSGAFMTLLALFFLAGSGWAGHWRQSIAIYLFAYLGMTYRSALIAFLVHYGFVFPALFYFLRRWVIIIIIGLIVGVFLIRYTSLFDDFVFSIGRQRFLYSIRGEFAGNYFEHRSLWKIDNFKVIVSVFLCLLVYFSRKNYEIKEYQFFILVPYLAYIILGFDAYLAQKTFLGFAFLAPFGVASLKGKGSRYLCGAVLVADLGSSSSLRFVF